jgi:predicted alpha/beta hydrolase
MMVDRRSLDRPEGEGLLSHLVQHGWNVFAPDLRGRGASGPTVAEGGRWSYDDLVRHDLPACLATVRARVPGLPVVFLGHSLGGHVSVAAAGCGAYVEPPDAHVLLSVNMWAPSLEPSRTRRLKKHLACLWLATVRLLFRRMPARLFRVGPVDEASDYLADLVRFWREDRWGSSDGGTDYLSSLARVKGPVLALVGRADRLLAHPEPARLWTEKIGAGQADFRVVGRGDYGLSFDPDHMTLATDQRSRPVWLEITSWLAECIATR